MQKKTALYYTIEIEYHIFHYKKILFCQTFVLLIFFSGQVDGNPQLYTIEIDYPIRGMYDFVTLFDSTKPSSDNPIHNQLGYTYSIQLNNHIGSQYINFFKKKIID